MTEQIAKAIAENGVVLFTASVVITLCVSAVLTAVALNFIGVQGCPGKVKREKKSPVATLSMLGFFVGFYLLIHHRVMAMDVDLGLARTMLIILGTLLVIIGAFVNILGRVQLGQNWANQVTVYESQQLVDSGVFGLVRHPLYASLIWMFVGASVVYLNPLALAATLLVFVPMIYFRARQEEDMLAENLSGYEEYQERVGMLWPKLLPWGKKQ